MAQVTLKGNAVTLFGDLPGVGDAAPDFSLTGAELADVSLEDYQGKKIVLNIFPSVDMSVCSASVRKFNSELAGNENTVVLCVSRDLPFAHSRFCEAEGITGVVSLSDMRDRSFGRDYGVEITDGPLTGLLARAVVVVDEAGKVVYNQLVGEISQEPDYEKALAALAGGGSLDACASSFSAEDARSDSIEEPCDDGRAG